MSVVNERAMPVYHGCPATGQDFYLFSNCKSFAVTAAVKPQIS